ncbi:26S proteasome regulatory subunit 4 homolog [Zingiber officinale]|uniref:26S proteasome regulatory subunit 4 homolog n=1 Tax=Zingiber officinale TaxID=94328 RepID=UPI001C4C215C|nr:26S proteasome regulatory subunit 4 homolog [Zingiber officinale]
MVSVMKVEKAPLESYVDIGGLDAQIQEIKEVVELPLTHPELYEDIGIRPPKGVILYGIVCVGGDDIVNEVLNGLLSRDNQKEALSITIGIIPAGLDNSLAWTILGVRDPISAAMLSGPNDTFV